MIQLCIRHRIKLIIKALHDDELLKTGVYKTSSPNLFTTVLTCKLLTESFNLLNSNANLKNEYLISKIKHTIQKSINLIHTEKTEGFTWNYWLRDSIQYKEKPYPDDLDDTFNCHLVLLFCEKNYLTSRTLFNITKTLLSTSVKFETGDNLDIQNQHITGFNTWIGSNLTDIDPVIQVLIYKVLQNIKAVPNDFEESIIHKILRLDVSFWQSKYYHSSLYILSELSSLEIESNNTTQSKIRNTLIKAYRCIISNQIKNTETHNVNSNLFNSILIKQIEFNLGLNENFSSTHTIFNLFKFIYIPTRQIKDEPIYVESISKNTITYCYSRSVVLALYIKTLSKILTSIHFHSRINKKIKKDTKKQESRQHNFKIILERITRNISSHYPNFSDKDIRNIFKSDNTLQNIHLELFDFTHNIKCPISGYWKMSFARTYEKINLIYEAILLGWIAYTIYDSIFDNEIDIEYLKIANICNLEMNYIFFHLLKLPKDILDIVHKKISIQNTSRNIDQGNKSVGHCLGPVCLFNVFYQSYDTADMHHLEQYYIHYLSLKQTSDDIHDWQEDISIGRHTYITNQILQDYETFMDNNISNGNDISKTNSSVDENNILKYTEIFTTKTVYNVYTDMITQTNLAIQHLLCIKKYFNAEYIHSRIEDTEKYHKGVKQLINEIELFNLLKK